MTNDEIKELLRELKKTSDEENVVRSKKVRITFDPEESEPRRQEGSGVSDRGREELPEEDAAPVERARRGEGNGILERIAAFFAGLVEKIRPQKKETSRRKRSAAVSDVIYEDDVDFLDKLDEETASDDLIRRVKRTRSRSSAAEAFAEAEEPAAKALPEVEEAAAQALPEVEEAAAQEIPEEEEAAAQVLPEEEETADAEESSWEADADEVLEEDSAKSSAAARLRSMFRGAGRGRKKEGAEEAFADAVPEAESAPADNAEEETIAKETPVEEPAQTAEEIPEEEIREETGAAADGFSDPASEEMAGRDAETAEETAASPKAEEKRARRISLPGGISKRELILIGSGLVILVLAVILGMHILSGSGRSSEGVTADEGLSVAILSQPQEWCSEGPVELSVKASGKIQSINVNGTDIPPQGGKKAKLEVTVNDPDLSIMVVTDKEVLSAQTKIPMIDATAPTVTISVSEGQAVLNAADNGSGVAHVYVGTVEGISDVPVYEEYTGPFPIENGKIYYYYAEDNAGNRSVPGVSSMEAVESLALSDTGLSLFPGESAKLQLRTVPEAGYVNDVVWSNSNEDAVRFDPDGTVTAVGRGTAVLTASAEGLDPVSCTVTVADEVPVTISAVGDCTLGTDIYLSAQGSFNSYFDSLGSSYFFQNVADIFKADDLTFANFEGTLTDRDTRADKQYAFKGDASYAQVLKDGGVEAVTLANNHSRDYGDESLTDTETALDAYGIAWCCGPDTAVVNANGIRVGLVGIYLLDSNGKEKEEQLRKAIEDVKAQGAKLIVVAFHWSNELQQEPDAVQLSFGHLAVDLGADLVVGHHPHILQGIETYNGKTIAYSLANFCFGGNNNPSDKDTIIFQQTFMVTEDGAEPGPVNIIPCSISSDPYSNNYQPTPAEGSEAARILQKLSDRSAMFAETVTQ